MDIDDPDDTALTQQPNAAVSGSSKKRRHPESVVAPPPKTSAEILQLIEHPNFEELARWNPVFQRAWNATRQLQKETNKTFSACVNQEFTVALTRALLRTHLDLQLPYLEENHLCPPVPNRFFYLHWIHTELLSSGSGHHNQQQRMGLDIGSGATAIYSLLAAKFFCCRMVTTEIDANAAAMAQKNVEANCLSSQIHVAHVPPSHSQDPSSLSPGGPLERSMVAVEKYLAQCPSPPHMTVDFVMTNPPFYDPSTMEHVNPRAGDGRARTAMTVSEGSYPGGEIGFVTEMIADSLRLGHERQSPRWFSSMLGKKTSLTLLQKTLTHVLGPAHVRVTEYGPGQYTRWFLAWTLERPLATALEARLAFQDDKFTVTLPANTNVSDPASAAVAEVVSRIAAYCESSPGGWKLTMSHLSRPDQHTTPATTAWLQIQESSPPPITTFVDESDPHTDQPLSIPTVILNALQHRPDNSHFLPVEGHFVMHLSVEAGATFSSDTHAMTDDDGDENQKVNVQFAAYRHSSRGQAAIKKIASTIQGEVCRTNRFWRRKLHRQNNP